VTTANIQTVQQIYEAFGRGDVATILEKVTDDVDWASECAPGVAPWHGVRRGKEQVRGFFEALGSTVEVLEFSPRAIAANETDVMVIIDFEMKVPATGRSGAMTLHHYWRLRDGKVFHYRGTEDTALTAALLAS
jgi:ketosteroid isomerase-like protein